MERLLTQPAHILGSGQGDLEGLDEMIEAGLLGSGGRGWSGGRGRWMV